MYFITTKRMLEVCFSAHPNIQYRTKKNYKIFHLHIDIFLTKVYNANSEIVN